MVERKKQKRFSGHGSMTKAGRVRDTTPRVKRTGVNSKKKKIPRLRYKDLYDKRIVKEEFGGQPNSIGAKRFEQKKKRLEKERKQWAKKR